MVKQTLNTVITYTKQNYIWMETIPHVLRDKVDYAWDEIVSDNNLSDLFPVISFLPQQEADRL